MQRRGDTRLQKFPTPPSSLCSVYSTNSNAGVPVPLLLPPTLGGLLSTATEPTATERCRARAEVRALWLPRGMLSCRYNAKMRTFLHSVEENVAPTALLPDHPVRWCFAPTRTDTDEEGN
jgi:hypothetical protein